MFSAWLILKFRPFPIQSSRIYPKIRAMPVAPGDKSPGYQYKVRLSGLNSLGLAVFRRLWMNSPDINVRAEWRKNIFRIGSYSWAV